MGVNSYIREDYENMARFHGRKNKANLRMAAMRRGLLCWLVGPVCGRIRLNYARQSNMIRR